MGSEEHIPSSATVEQFTNAMREKAAAEYVDSAVDPDWKVLSSPDYPGRVDSKEWIKKRQLRHSHVCYKQHTSENYCVSDITIGFISVEIVFTTTAVSSSLPTPKDSLGSPYSSSLIYTSPHPHMLTSSVVGTWICTAYAELFSEGFHMIIIATKRTK